MTVAVGFKNNCFKIISMVSIRGILVNKFSISNDAITQLGLQEKFDISFTNEYEFLHVYALVVKGDKIGTKNLAMLKLGVL